MRLISLFKKTAVENLRDWKILILTLAFGPFFVVLMYLYLGETAVDQSKFVDQATAIQATAPDAGAEGKLVKFSGTGKTTQPVADEKYVEMATAVSASGPAFVFLVMEALTDAGVHIGLRRDLTIEMVTQLVLGTARLAQETGTPFSELRHMVTSPAGTTAEGLRVLENARVRAAMIEAIIATYEKAQGLGG